MLIRRSTNDCVQGLHQLELYIDSNAVTLVTLKAVFLEKFDKCLLLNDLLLNAVRLQFLFDFEAAPLPTRLL